ncbi:MAG: hypothetical protein KF900_14180 [Bacteroidetes bacterium]|nr:hypothetical protein [Bacteroidota bacterium]
MNSFRHLYGKQVVGLALITAFFAACSSDAKKEDKEDLIEVADTVRTIVVNVDGELFSIPSPIQTAQLVQKSGIAYDKSVLNEEAKVVHYSTEFSRALNLGVYGADLGYVALYGQTQDVLSYISSVRQLSDKLGVSAAFDENTMNRFKNNVTNKDSMMNLVGVAFRSCDAYLKENNRSNVSTLVVTGGWIEGMHFTLTAYKNKPTEMLKERIASQKQAVSSLIKILSTNTSEEATDMLVKFAQLADIYNHINLKYVYVAPTTDAEKKLTYINSKSEIYIAPEQLTAITRIVGELRNIVVNTTQS